MRKIMQVRSLIAAILAVGAGFAQQAPTTRGIQNPAVAQQDRAKKIQEQAAKAQPKPAASPAAAKASPSADSILGMNLWHMRLADSTSPVKTRGLRHKLDPAGSLDWTPERLTLDDVIPEGELLRLSFESASAGYLYVIDRDVFANGTKSKPTLRFPTKQIRGGDNLVGPGVLIQIPGSSDKPSAFTVEVNHRKEQAGIMVTLILSPGKPLPEIPVPNDAVELSEALVAKYEKEFGSDVKMVENKSMLKMVSTLAESAAASDPSRPLGAEDPLPITLFDRAGHPGAPMLATALIKVKSVQ
jgi:hypothetical protein